MACAAGAPAGRRGAARGATWVRVGEAEACAVLVAKSVVAMIMK